MTVDIYSANKQLNEWCGTDGVNYYEGITALGSLFKYAAPKLKERVEEPELAQLLFCWVEKILANQAPALALFQAIYKALEVKNKRR